MGGCVRSVQNSRGVLTSAYGDVPPKLVIFHQKSSDKGPILVKIILRRGSYFTKKKIEKSTVFEIGKPLIMGPVSENFGKQSKQPYFEGEDMGNGFKLQATPKYRQKCVYFVLTELTLYYDHLTYIKVCIF